MDKIPAKLPVEEFEDLLITLMEDDLASGKTKRRTRIHDDHIVVE